MTQTVLVPSSLVREADGKREATRKIGTVARAAAIFQVDHVVVFPDPVGEEALGGRFVETVLAYAATPPYLRKVVWDRRPELAYAGVLPPLHVGPRTGSGSTDSGSLRQGIVTEVGSEGRVRVNCGLQHPISLRVPSDMTVAEGERVTVRVSSRRPVRARLTDEPSPGYSVTRADLAATLEAADAGLAIATSRHGRPLTRERLASLATRIPATGLTVAFGAPGRGLPEILEIDPSELEADPGPFDCWLNTIPNQGTETVRTEEAMIASLAVLALTE